MKVGSGKQRWVAMVWGYVLLLALWQLSHRMWQRNSRKLASSSKATVGETVGTTAAAAAADSPMAAVDVAQEQIGGQQQHAAVGGHDAGTTAAATATSGYRPSQIQAAKCRLIVVHQPQLHPRGVVPILHLSPCLGPSQASRQFLLYAVLALACYRRFAVLAAPVCQQ